MEPPYVVLVINDYPYVLLFALIYIFGTFPYTMFEPYDWLEGCKKEKVKNIK
jgi:hypothetical protein